MNDVSVVYFAQAPYGGAIKIGHTYRHGRRLGQISDELPFELVPLGSCPGGLFRERFIQCWFQPSHIRGEWFGQTPELWRWAMESQGTGDLHLVPPEPENDFQAACTDSICRFLKRSDIDFAQIATIARIRVASVEAGFAKPYLTSRLLIAASLCLLSKAGWAPIDWWQLRYRGEAPKRKPVREKRSDPPRLRVIDKAAG